MSNLSFNFSESPFEAIKRIENGIEFWYARELMSLLGYKKWERFNDVIEIAIENLKTLVDDASVHASLYWEASGRTKRVNYKLSRLACYHIALCCDSRGNDAVKMAKHYFAVKTRQAETGQVNPPQATKQVSEPEGIIKLLEQALVGVDLKTELLAGIKLNIMKVGSPKEYHPVIEEARQLLIVNTAQPEKLMTPTDIGKVLNLSGQAINKLLIANGLQTPNENRKSKKEPAYLPTEKGKEYSDLTLATGSNSSSTYQQLRWYESVIDLLR